ncbi:MAG: hypothetical protein ACO3YY_03650 [Phycisphaerales bacterium]
MATQYTSILKLALPVQGELSGTWGDVVNDNITSMVEEAIAGRAVIDSWTANSHTLTTANGTTSESRCAMLEFTDTGVALTGAGAGAAVGAADEAQRVDRGIHDAGDVPRLDDVPRAGQAAQRVEVVVVERGAVHIEDVDVEDVQNGVVSAVELDVGIDDRVRLATGLDRIAVEDGADERRRSDAAHTEDRRSAQGKRGVLHDFPSPLVDLEKPVPVALTGRLESGERWLPERRMQSRTPILECRQVV